MAFATMGPVSATSSGEDLIAPLMSILVPTIARDTESVRKNLVVVSATKNSLACPATSGFTRRMDRSLIRAATTALVMASACTRPSTTRAWRLDVNARQIPGLQTASACARRDAMAMDGA